MPCSAVETVNSVVAMWNAYRLPGTIDEVSLTPCDKVTVKTVAMWNIHNKCLFIALAILL